MIDRSAGQSRPAQLAAQPDAVAAHLPSLARYVQERDELDNLTEASNAIVDMVHAGNLDAAERATHDLLARSRMSMTATTASAWSAKAADYYRRAIDVIRDHPENYDIGFETIFQKLVARLEA